MVKISKTKITQHRWTEWRCKDMESCHGWWVGRVSTAQCLCCAKQFPEQHGPYQTTTALTPVTFPVALVKYPDWATSRITSLFWLTNQGYSLCWRKSQQSELEAAGLIVSTAKKQGWMLVFSYLSPNYVRQETYLWDGWWCPHLALVFPPQFSIWKITHRHGQRVVSKVALDPVKLSN